MRQGVINFAVYEDRTEFVGMAKVTLPDINFLTQTISGAGIGGNVEAVLAGMVENMTVGMSFNSCTDQAIKLAEPRRHNIDLRIAQNVEDTVAGTIKPGDEKHVMVVIPKSTKLGTVAPASSMDASGEYACRYWAAYIDGKKMIEIDPLNNICYINGTDYLADVRKALGK